MNYKIYLFIAGSSIETLVCCIKYFCCIILTSLPLPVVFFKGVLAFPWSSIYWNQADLFYRGVEIRHFNSYIKTVFYTKDMRVTVKVMEMKNQNKQNWHVYPLNACLILIQVQTGFHKCIGKVLTFILTVVLSYYKVNMRCYKSVN